MLCFVKSRGEGMLGRFKLRQLHQDCTAAENHLSKDGQDSEGPWPPWKVAGLSHQPCTVLLTAQPWLMGGKRVKGVSLGSWGAVFLTKSQILHPWQLALLAHKGHGWRKILPLILVNPRMGCSSIAHCQVPEIRSQRAKCAPWDFSQKPAKVRPLQNKWIWTRLLAKSFRLIISS